MGISTYLLGINTYLTLCMINAQCKLGGPGLSNSLRLRFGLPRPSPSKGIYDDLSNPTCPNSSSSRTPRGSFLILGGQTDE
jgi:hypothetical protein